jgi:hypothetical protein
MKMTGYMTSVYKFCQRTKIDSLGRNETRLRERNGEAEYVAWMAGKIKTYFFVRTSHGSRQFGISRNSESLILKWNIQK